MISRAATTIADGELLAVRERRLHQLLSSYESALIAFSGGVDSAYLALTATRVLGRAALCVTADSASYPEHHRQLALRIARECGLNHEVVHTGELERADYRANPVNRCYFCKHELFTTLCRIARDRGCRVVVDGNNADDRGDYRPGRQAAREFGVRSPLDDADLTKDDIRELARRAGLSTWDEPASACLSSRIPYHSEVTDEKLRRIEQAETAIRRLGFRICRVRHHGDVARVEVAPADVDRAMQADMSGRIAATLRGLGYSDVTIDPRGYRMGSLNEGVRLRPA